MAQILTPPRAETAQKVTVEKSFQMLVFRLNTADVISGLYPNSKKSYYKEYARTPLIFRLEDAEKSAERLYAERIDDIQTDTEKRALELLADYILAEDHAKGLKPRRQANEYELNEYPSLGEGASEYLERQYVGFPLTPYERKRVKVCEICEGEFIDRTKPGNAKRCGPTCNAEYERRRKRKSYNVTAHGHDDMRLYNDWSTQQLEYPFYNPKELYELERSQFVKSEDEFEKGYVAKKANKSLDFEGRRKARFRSSTDIEGESDYESMTFRYDPKKKDKKADIWWSEIRTYRLSEIDLDKDKFIEAGNVLEQYKAILD